MLLDEIQKKSNRYFAAGDGKTRLTAEVLMIGNDLCISLLGGRGHLGSVVMAEPRLSLDTLSDAYSATSSVINRVGHKDELMIRTAAEKIASSLKINVVICGGCHLEAPDKDDLQKVMDNALLIAEKIIMFFADETV